MLRKLTHFILITLFVLQSVLYPWVSILPAPPPIYAQEASPPEASDSSQTPAPTPLDPLETLEETLFPSTQSAETITPETTPEASSSATPSPIPETTPEATPSATPLPCTSSAEAPEKCLQTQSSLGDASTSTPSPTTTAAPTVVPSPSVEPVAEPVQVLQPPSIDPFLINLKYPFVGTYPISYYFGQESSSSYVRLMQSVFDVTAHDGVDFGMDQGVEILATDGGTVTHAGPGTYGITVIIKHSWGTSYYGHLSQVNVTAGDIIITGSVIGLSGNTGITTGPHLHFGIRPNHYDPYNGYRGLIDPLPHLTGSVLGASNKIKKVTFAHILKPTLLAEDQSVGLLLTEDPSSLTFSLRNPRGDSTFIYPTVYNFGTGETALITRPNPFVPGRYTVTIAQDDGTYDEQTFDWGVLTLNTDQASYAPGSIADVSLAVLDHGGEMVCDAQLSLTITAPNGEQSILTTPSDIAVNQTTCESKDLTLSPDYHTTYQTQNSGTYNLVLTATTTGGTYTVNDSFEVRDDLPFKLKRLSATRIYPAHHYPVIFEITPNEDYQGQISELVPDNFDIQPLSLDELKDWTQSEDDSKLLTQSYDQQDNTLTWDLDLQAGETYYLGYSYDSPDESPRLYTLGPATLGDYTETRVWNIAVDAVTKYLGYFSPPTTWTVANNADLVLAQPDPRDGDLMVATLAIRPSSSTINTPSGWTLLDSQTGTDGGAEGADTGSVGLYTFYKEADGTEGNTTVTFTETGTTSVWTGYINKVRSATGTYNLNSAGYSINTDGTNWNGTLDADIGLTAGDLVLLVAAQNGDGSNTSAWGIAATGVTSVSSSNEHGEYTTSSGNDLEVGIATTQVWEGTNSATPTVTLTQSAAVSGTVMAIRIRQGSGTNRTDSWVRAAGPQIGGTASVAVAFPEHDPGDLLLLFVGSRISTDATPTTPTGWTSLGSYNGGTGTFGADAGNARTTVYYLQTGLRMTGTQTVALGSGNTMIGQMISLHHDGNVNWQLDSDGGTDTSAGTDWSVTGSGIDLSNANGGDLVLVGSAVNTDAYTYSSPGLSASGVTVGEVTMTGQFITANGNDMGLTVATARITGGSSSAAPTYTMTSSGTAGSAPTGSSMLIKVNTTSITTDENHVGYFSPPSTWTSVGNADILLPQPDPRSGDLMIATIAIRPSASNIATPTGWDLIDSRTATDGGAEGADTGSVKLYTFTKVADGSEGSSTVTFVESGTTSVVIGNISKARSATGTYDVSGSSYAISGDSTNWNGTLSADIGLTQGDVVLLIGAQNGDLSNTSAWDIAASGITTKSSVNEHGEYTSSTGNDIEVGLAATQIWEGTNSATPTVALTQSVATSGVVMAVRIRQGSGTNRTDSWVRSAGPQIGGTASVAVVYPEHEIGDLLLLFVGSRISTDATPTTPSGWTSLGTYNGGTGTFGADAGNARTTVYYAQAGTRMTGVATVALGSGNTMVGQIVAIHHDNDDVEWQLDSDGGTDTSAGTDWSVTGSGIDLSNANGGDLVLVGSAVNTDAYTYTAPALSATGVTVGEVTMTGQFNTANGNDMGLNIATARITAGSGSGAPTYTMTSSSSGASAPTGSSMFVRVSGLVSSISVSGTANGNNGATVKIAVNNAVQDQDTTISSGTWSITGVALPTANDIITVWIDNVTDSNESTAATKWVTGSVSGMVLNTNTLSIGSDQDSTLSLTDLNLYDCTEDEDIMHQAASSHLKVEGDACAGSTTNSYSAETLSIIASNTLAVATSETVSTHNVSNAGTITSTGNATYNVANNWANTGTFTSATSTVNLNGADSSTQTISGDTSFYNLSASTSSNSAGRTIRFTAGTTTTVTGTWTVTGTSSKIVTLESSTTSIWNINPTVAVISYVDVSYSNNIGASFCPVASIDGGNNVGWYLPCSPTAHSFQRKTWHDGTRYWRGYYDHSDSRVEFEYSSDGISWTENTSARIATTTPDFSIEADGSNALIAYANTYDIKGRKATSYPATNFGWDTESTILNGSSVSDHYTYPVVARDSSSYIWIGARYRSNGGYYIKTIKETSTTNDLPEDSGDAVYSLANRENESSGVYVNLTSIGSQNMYASFTEGTAIIGCRWVNTSTQWQDESGDNCADAGDTPPIQVSVTSDTTTTSTSFVQMDSMSYTPGSGDYLVSFNTSIQKSTGSSSQEVALYVGNSLVSNSVRFLEQDSSYDAGSIYVRPVSIQAYVSSVGPSDAIEIRWLTSAGTATAKERTLIIQPVQASDMDQVGVASETTTTSATDTLMNSMTITPGTGDYMIYFSSSMESTTTSMIYFSIYVNGVQIDHSERELYTEATFFNTYYPVATHAYAAGVGASDAIEVRWRTTAGTAWASQRILTVQKVSSSAITQVDETSAAGSTATSDTQVDTMTISPGLGNYLVYFSTSLSATDENGSTQKISIYTSNNQVAHTQRHMYTEESYDSGSIISVNVSSQAYITDLGPSDTINVRYQTSAGTVTASKRTLTIIKFDYSSPNFDNIATRVDNSTSTHSATGDNTGNVHLVYTNASNHVVYKQRTTTWQTAVTLDSNAGNAYPTLSRNTDNDDLYAFWIRGDDIYYKKGVADYESGDWDVSATSWQTTGTNVYVTAGAQSSSSSIFAQWYDGTNVDWDLISTSANQAPNTPSSLLQLTTSDVTITTGGWHNTTSIKFSATADDPDGSDTLYLCVEADQLGTGFSNTEDSCGSGGAYAGSPISITHTITLTDAQEYHWQVRVKDTAGAYSAWVSYGGNAESARDFGIDTTAPTGGTVYDGTSVGVDITFGQSSLSSLSANWDSFNTDVSGLLRYDYSFGTSAGATDIKAWTDNSTTTSVTATGLTLQTGQMYYVNVRAVDNAGNVQSAVSSNGQLVSPSITFAITPATATFNNLGAGNSFTDTETTTLTTSTNAYNGYVIRAFVTDYLKSLDDSQSIADFSGGSYASPATWNGSETGFGYTSSDTTIQGVNKFGSGTLYAPFSQTGPGDIVADHTSNVTGTGIDDEVFTITYKVKVPESQAASTYDTTVVYTATAQY